MSDIKLLKHNGFIEVILSRPDTRNAFHPKMIQELTEAFERVEASMDLRFVVLRGEGKAFCAGADLNWMKSMVDFSFDENLQDSVALQKMFAAIENCPVPVLTYVHGFVMGGALGLVAASDIVIADSSTQFCFSEVRLGLLPAVISEFVMHKASSHAMRAYLISGEMFDASKAFEMNLVTGLVAADESENWLHGKFENLNWIRRLLENAPEAMVLTKKLLADVTKAPAQQVPQLTTQAIASKRISAEGQEGLKSFLEKRNPSWRQQ